MDYCNKCKIEFKYRNDPEYFEIYSLSGTGIKYKGNYAFQYCGNCFSEIKKLLEPYIQGGISKQVCKCKLPECR